MQKNKPNVPLPIFPLLAAGATIVLLFGVIVLPFFTLKKIELEKRGITVYDDRSEKEMPGNSEILSISHESTEIKFSYILRKGYTYPYAGIKVNLKDSNGKFLDCTSFDVLKISIASSRLADCKLYLKVFDQKVSRENDPLSERFLYKELIVGTDPMDFSIPLKKMITPEWWYQKNNITLSDAAPVDFSQVTALKIESGATAKTGIVDTINVSGIYLVKNPDTLAIVLLIGILVFIIVITIFRLFPHRKSRNPIVITYDKKEISNYRDLDARRISTHIAEHFSEPSLSILEVGRSLGLSQKKIAKVMNQEFTMSFKQYLTSIRIHEAKRLLRETDRLVFDIALAVGFNSISHFNRVFKNATQVSPLEFRNNRKSVND
jgi:AraC-like DNA-binding protein